MSVLGLAVGAFEFLAEHWDVVEDVADAIAGGSPKDAIKAAIRGVRVQASRDALAEEFGAAENRRNDNHGAVAYAAYAVSTGGKTYDGRDMPTWEGLTDKIRTAWEAAADAARGA